MAAEIHLNNRDFDGMIKLCVDSQNLNVETAEDIVRLLYYFCPNGGVGAFLNEIYSVLIQKGVKISMYQMQGYESLISKIQGNIRI